jgi:hypothetical protein
MSDTPLLTIRKFTSRVRLFRLSTGKDPHYDLTIRVGDVGEDDTAPDGVFRPAAQLVLGGLAEDRGDDSEVRIMRSLGEDELRWIAKTCLAAAGTLRRMENARRRAKQRPEVK